MHNHDLGDLSDLNPPQSRAAAMLDLQCCIAQHMVDFGVSFSFRFCIIAERMNAS
jgi:hypothetical protein